MAVNGTSDDQLVVVSDFNTKDYAILDPGENPVVDMRKNDPPARAKNWRCGSCDEVVAYAVVDGQVEPSILLRCGECSAYNRFPDWPTPPTDVAILKGY